MIYSPIGILHLCREREEAVGADTGTGKAKAWVYLYTDPLSGFSHNTPVFQFFKISLNVVIVWESLHIDGPLPVFIQLSACVCPCASSLQYILGLSVNILPA